MQWFRHGLASWDSAMPFPALRSGGYLRDVARGAVVIAALVMVVYCVETAWAVLGELRTVKLVDCSRALTVISVRDAVLCLVGWRLGTELLRAVVRTRRPQ